MSEDPPVPDASPSPEAFEWYEDPWSGPLDDAGADAGDDPWSATLDDTPSPHGRPLGLRRSAAVAVALCALVLGSAVGGFLITRSGPLTTASAASSSTATTSPSPGAHFRGGFGGAFAGVNLVQDAATAIGISEQTLQSDLRSGQTVAQVAAANGSSAQAVITALVGDETTAINSLESSGKITSSQATQMESNLTQMVTSFVNQTRPATPPSGSPSAFAGGSGEPAALQAAATAIGNGVTASTLQSDLASGQSIADVASAHNVSIDSVVSAVTTVVDSQISSLESSGKLSSAQASALTADVQSRVSDWVNGTYPGWPFGPFGGWGGGSFRGGPWGQWNGASPSPSPATSTS
jgi:hypothetical protein